MSNHTTSDATDPDARRVRLWMRDGLDNYLDGGKGRWAFRPHQHEIGLRDDLADDLRAVFDELEPDDQRRWRLATVDILASQARDPAKREANNVLMDLAALIRADVVLDVLPDLVTHDDALLVKVVGTAVALTGENVASRECLQRIRTSPMFSADYAGLVLAGLCRADPDAWVIHVATLGGDMKVLAARLDDDSTALRHYARMILEAVTLERVGNGELNRLGDIQESWWLLTEWMGGPAPLVHYEADAETGPRLRLASNGAVTKRLDEPLLDGRIGGWKRVGTFNRAEPHNDQ